MPRVVEVDTLLASADDLVILATKEGHAVVAHVLVLVRLDLVAGLAGG